MDVLSANPAMALQPTAYQPVEFPPSPKPTLKGGASSGSEDDESDIVGSSSSVVDAFETASRAYALPPPSRENKVLPEDLKTPDSHVPRDPRLIRLTGLHPFNVEAPLSALYDEGFLTTKDLHYVRNHGPVPLVEDEEVMTWEFVVEGLVETPLRLTLRDLIGDFEQLTYPITLVCAGNRRKEQNIVRKTKGFSWGAAGVSTALWTGVALDELLRRASPKRGAKFVCFEGAEKLPNGYYGTSVKLNWAMDPERGMLVAHRMNGEPLPPDHGRPLRIVIPGQIGGRSVKWLKKITVTATPSDSWYHIYDNRVLPTMITPEASASLPDTWKDERYAIYDLNTNSATAYPAHDETLSLSGNNAPYSVRGYAYAGGGKRISRVEVTLDKGRTWRLASIRYPEDDYRLAPEGETIYGGRIDLSWREACYCWCFWDLDIAVADLEKADDIMVRVMDDSMMVQPRDMYWSVLGMMNNPWYRVVVHREADSLRFEHPTQPALIPGGWMERVKKAGGNLTNGNWGERTAGEAELVETEEPAKEIKLTKEGVDRQISASELKLHDGDASPWFVVNGQVFDGTPFLEGHPGGAASIRGAAGQDVTEEFMAIHSENAKAMMPDYHIGALDAAARAKLDGAGEEESDATRAVFLQSKIWSKAILVEKTRVSADTKVFTFKLDHEEQTVGLPIGQHLMMRLRDPASREVIIRAYTPMSEGTDKGQLKVLVKIYYDTADRKGGKMTQALDAIPIGHFVDFKGPVGKFEYLGNGLCTVGGRKRTVRRFIMVCGGSGITPIFQVLRAVLKDPEDKTACLVLYGNRTEEDILCRAELDAMSEGQDHKCKLQYSLSKPHGTWQGRCGRMDEKLFRAEAGTPSKDGDELVLICGPEPLEQSAKTIFTDIGWAEDDMLFF